MGRLVQGSTIAPLAGDIRLSGAFRLAARPDSDEYLLDVIGGGSSEAPDLDSIPGVLNAAKMYGDAGISSLWANTVGGGVVQAKDDPSDAHPTVEIQGSFGRIDFGTASLAADVGIGRLSTGLLGSTAGALKADALGAAGHDSAYHLARSNHTGIEDLAHGGTGVDASALAINQILASPGSGGAGGAAFRALVAADIPTLDTSKLGTGQLGLARGGTAVDGTSQAINLVLASPASGGAGALSLRSLVANDIPTVTTAKISDFAASVLARMVANSIAGDNVSIAYDAIGGTLTWDVSSFPTSDLAGIVSISNGGTGVDGSSQAINLVFASPASGGAGAMGPRALVAGDIPTLTAVKISDFTATARGAISILDGTNIDLSYNSTTGVITASITGTLAKANQNPQTAYLDAASGQTFANLNNFTNGVTIGSVSGNIGKVQSAAGNSTGFFIQGRNGTTYCFGVLNEAGALCLRIPNSTQDVQCLAALSVAGAFAHTGTTFGAFNVSPVSRPAAYTQTYATATRTHSARTAVALTDNIAGTVNATLAAIPDPADTPATADALRDDIVANVLPKIRNALSSIVDAIGKRKADCENSAQVANQIIDDLQSLGLQQ